MRPFERAMCPTRRFERTTLHKGRLPTSGACSSSGLMAWRYVATSPTITRVTASIKKPASPSMGPQPFSKLRRSNSMDVITSSWPKPWRRRLATMYEMVCRRFACDAVVR